jgi:hypothetical protein
LGLDDNIEANVSTFAAEMKETAFILRNIDRRSLLVDSHVIFEIEYVLIDAGPLWTSWVAAQVLGTVWLLRWQSPRRWFQARYAISSANVCNAEIYRRRSFGSQLTSRTSQPLWASVLECRTSI